MVHSSAFNEDDLLRRLMGNRQLAAMVLREFLQDAPAQLSDLQRRLDDHDANGIRTLGHTLRGASATVGAERLSAVAAELEMAGRSGDLPHCGELVRRAFEEFSEYATTLKRCGWIEAEDHEK